MRRSGSGMSLSPRVGEAGEDPAAVVLADRAAHQAVGLQPRNDAAQGALREMHRAGQIVDPAALLALGDEAVEDLELAQAEAVAVLELALQGSADTRVTVQQTVPFVEEQCFTWRSHGRGL